MTTLDTGRGASGDSGGPGPTEACTGTFDALGHRFAVAGEDARTIALVEEAFAVLAVCAPPLGWYHLQRHADCVELTWNGKTVGTVTDCADALALLRSDVQRRAIAAADTDLVLRAGSVECDGRALVLSGSTGCGVSTLLAALVSEGCRYLSDDAIPVELRTGMVRPFPQPVLLDDRSLDLLPEITALRSGVESTHGRRLVAMRSGRALAEPTSCTVSTVLFPELDDSGITMLDPVDPDDAVLRLAEHAYNFPGHEQEAIEAIDWLVRDANAFTVIGSDPHASARAVIDALALAT